MLMIVPMRDKALHDAAEKLSPTRPVGEMARGENVRLSVFTSLSARIAYKAKARRTKSVGCLRTVSSICSRSACRRSGPAVTATLETM